MNWLNNKYTNWYNRIIRNAQSRELDTYYEIHHIVPKSLGGTNQKSNLVKLTAKEHYVCHLLLMKMYSDKKAKQKMASAFLYMSKVRNDHTKRRYTSILYERHKIIRQKILSEQMSGSGNPMFGKVHSEKTRNKISNARIGVNTNTSELIERKRNKWLSNNPNYNPEIRQRMNEKQSKNYIVIDPSGNTIEVKNLKQFCIENNLHNGNMCSVAKGKLNHYKGWTCKYIS